MAILRWKGRVVDQSCSLDKLCSSNGKIMVVSQRAVNTLGVTCHKKLDILTFD